MFIQPWRRGIAARAIFGHPKSGVGHLHIRRFRKAGYRDIDQRPLPRNRCGLIQSADEALYRAKGGGRNQIALSARAGLLT